jgi:2-dehydropantoate 2-reductase
MLQDVEGGRDPEIDALVGSVIEVGRIVGEPTPTIEAVFALVKLLARTMREEKVYIRAHPLIG